MYDGGGSTPTPLSLRGVGTPPCPFILHPFPLPFVWNSRRRIQVSGRCRKGGVPPTRFHERLLRQRKIFGRYRPLPTPLGTLGVATPPLRFGLSDGGFIAATFVSRAKGGVATPPMPWGVPPVTKVDDPPLPPYKFFLRQRGVATPQGEWMGGYPPFMSVSLRILRSLYTIAFIRAGMLKKN